MVPLGEVGELLRGITFGKSEQLERGVRSATTINKAAQSSGIVEDKLYPSTKLDC